MLLSRKPHFLGSCRSPSIDTNTYCPKDKCRGTYTLVSYPSSMSSYGLSEGSPYFPIIWLFLTRSTSATTSQHWDLYRFWSMQYLVKDPRCHLTLAHWWVYSRDLNRFMSLVIFGLRWRQCSEAPSVLLYRFMIDAAYLYHRDYDSPSVSPYSYVPFQDPVGY